MSNRLARMADLIMSNLERCIVTVIGEGEADIKFIAWSLPQYDVDDIRLGIDQLIKDGALVSGDVGYRKNT